MGIRVSDANPYESQKNKKHVKKNEKLERKKRVKKNKKKTMDIRAKLRLIKKDKDIMRKQAIISERFAQKVHCDEIIVIR